ncbi:MAG: hypothetical protein DWP97_12625 [Calditrichaeota bacterium]|nr:MAG: hypothetical protein DWP97_12625 [Calditrichota bacterium]
MTTVAAKSMLIFILIIFVVLLSPVSKSENVPLMLGNYFDLLVSGNTESAYFLWTEEARERAGRFGIEYTDIPLKIDCNSPIVRDIEMMRDYLQPPVKTAIQLNDGFTTLRYSHVIKGDLVEYDYTAREINGYQWLTFKQQYYTSGWKTTSSKYFNIRHVDYLKTQLNPIVLDEADAFVERMAQMLELSNDDLNLLAEKKMEYFYCENDEKVKLMTGHLIKGTFDLPSNDIISAFFPHYHEITHLLINFKLRKLPLYTLPIFREGIAVHLAGRWGKAPKTLEGIGEFLISQDIVNVDSILTMSSFNKNSQADVAYPAAGLFTGYLIDEIGLKKYLEMYLEFSGKFKPLLMLSVADIQHKILSFTNKTDWKEVQDSFASFLKRQIKEKALMLPGSEPKAKEVVQHENITISETSDWFCIEVDGAQVDTVKGNLLFGFDEQLTAFVSSLKGEQYKSDGALDDGFRYGVRFDQNEVGVYDYATSHLVAKYIFGLNPSDEYFNGESKKLRFKFRKDVLHYALTDKTEFKLLAD